MNPRKIQLLASSPAHAVLFYSSRGTGLLDHAWNLARNWMCPNAKDGEACGECQVCKQTQKRAAMDALEVQPAGPSSLIRLDAISGGSDSGGPSLSDFVMRAPLLARHKVVVINRPERMNSAAANALLKTLEEPTARVKMVMACEEIGSVLPTIVSRCLCVACPMEAGAQDQDEAVRIFGEGAPGLEDQVRRSQEAYAATLTLLDSMLNAGREAGLGLADKFRKLSAKFDEKELGGARGVNVELLRCLGLWAKARVPELISVRQEIHEAHRRVLGNGSMAYQTDPIFCRIMTSLANRER